MPDDIGVLDWLIRLGLAGVLSGVIGFERETRHKAAGLRTHMLVAMGAALFTILSASAFDEGDPTRIAAQIVSGVGFLGAGAIFRSGANVHGLTTAAGLWAVAALGMAAGAGLEEGAVLATALGVLVLTVLRVVERRWIRTGTRRTIGVTTESLGELQEIVSTAHSIDVSSRRVAIETLPEGRFHISFSIGADLADAAVAAFSTYGTVRDVSELDPHDGDD